MKSRSNRCKQSDSDSPSDSSLDKIEKGSIDYCSNKSCPQSKHIIPSTANDVDSLCRACKEQYRKNSFCLYCKQVYYENTDDGKWWIMCDICTGWVHMDCADVEIDVVNYNCIKCKKPDESLKRQGSSKPMGMNRGLDRRKNTECRLNAFGFYWQLSQTQLNEDYEKFKMYLN